MTATIKPPKPDDSRRPVRSAWMDSLGFSQSSDVWSDSRGFVQRAAQVESREVPTLADEPTLIDVAPSEIGRTLRRGNVRWGAVIAVSFFVGLLAYGGLWLYERPQIEARELEMALAADATSLSATLGAVESSAASLTSSGEVDRSALIAANDAARHLFETSGATDLDQTLRSHAATSSSLVLDATRLISEANAYARAVEPILVSPGFETDPAVIAIDEAARTFGEWQIGFDQARTALPDNVLSDVTVQLDVLSGNLSSLLSSYVDALRLDDMANAHAVLTELDLQLSRVGDELEAALVEVQERALGRIAEARASLDLLLR